MLPIALGLVVAALAIFFTLTGNIFSVFVLLPLCDDDLVLLRAAGPPRRYRRAIAELPRWELRPSRLDRLGRQPARRSGDVSSGGISGVSSRSGTPVRSSTTLR